MSTDHEFDSWRKQWQADSSGDSDRDLASTLKEHTLRQSRRNVIGMIFPVLVTVVIGGGILLRALQTTQPLDVAVAVEGWIFIALTWAGALWIARRTWRPLGETTRDFLDLSIRRCRANIRAVPLALALYVGQLIMVVFVVLSYSDTELTAVLTTWPTGVLAFAGLPLLVAWGIWFAKRQRGKLETFLTLRDELDQQPDELE